MPGLDAAPPVPRAEGMDSLKSVLWTAGIIVAVCAVIGVTVNALRPEGISLIQHTQYEILVPCPETSGVVETVAADHPAVLEKRTLLIDARATSEHAQWHPPGSLNVPFDYLEPVEAKTLRAIAASGAARVVVYGDGRDPDSGEHLAKEISGRGIRNVGFVPGGAPSLRRALAGGNAP
jgi:rhodanese-related sulfurtransferase